jgi:hypothetical protein
MSINLVFAANKENQFAAQGDMIYSTLQTAFNNESNSRDHRQCSTHKNADMHRPITSTITVTNTANQFKLI